MEAELQHVKREVFDAITEFLPAIKKKERYKIKEFLPKELRKDVDSFYKELEAVVVPEDSKWKERKEAYKKFTTQINHNYGLVSDMYRKQKALTFKYNKMRKELATTLYEMLGRQPEDEEEQEEQEEIVEEYDLTGSGEPVYETPIMTPQLNRRIMANEFNQDQVEYIIKKSLRF